MQCNCKVALLFLSGLLQFTAERYEVLCSALQECAVTAQSTYKTTLIFIMNSLLNQGFHGCEIIPLLGKYRSHGEFTRIIISSEFVKLVICKLSIFQGVFEER